VLLDKRKHNINIKKKLKEKIPLMKKNFRMWKKYTVMF